MKLSPRRLGLLLLLKKDSGLETKQLGFVQAANWLVKKGLAKPLYGGYAITPEGEAWLEQNIKSITTRARLRGIARNEFDNAERALEGAGCRSTRSTTRSAYSSG